MTGRVTFGPFVLDLDTRELRRSNVPVPLSPKAFQMLEILVASAPKALSKSELQNRLWPDTFVVEKNLANLAVEIRDALGDDAAHPQFLRTVPRFGYAFRDASRVAAGRSTGAAATAPRFRLVWPEGHSAMTEGEHVIGRDPDVELFFDLPGISRRHALIRISGRDATVEDLGSKNGTFIGDRRVDGPTRLTHDDTIRVGSVRLTFKAVRPQGSTETERLRG